MTITRIHQDGFEFGGTATFESRPWALIAATFSINSSNVAANINTGQWGAVSSVASLGGYIPLDSAIAQMRCGFMFKISGGADTPGIFFLDNGFPDATNLTLHIYYEFSTDDWYIYAGATQLGTFNMAVDDSTWRHIGIDFKCHASTGWCYVYIDGVAKLSYTGKTNYGDSTFDLIGIGSISATYDGWDSLSIDDFYVDNSTGEGSPSPVTKKFFYPLDVDGTGNYAEWHGSDGDQTNNYSLLDVRSALSAISADGLIESSTSNHRDSWTLEATPAGVAVDSVIAAVIPTFLMQNRSTSGNVQVRAFTRYSGSNSDGSVQTPPIHYGQVWERFTTDPASASWTKSSVDSTEIGVKFE